MSFMLRILALVSVITLAVQARAPLESYKRYMFVMVHGIGGNTLEPHDYDPSNNNYRKSAIFDKTPDDIRGFLGHNLDSVNWQGNLGGTLQDRGFLGHTVWYDFKEPWRSPIYTDKFGNDSNSLSQYLGDRKIDDNPMREEGFGQTAQSYWLNEFFGEKYKERVDTVVKYTTNPGPFLELAQEDYKQWSKLRYNGVVEEEIPKKYILIGHSMGGLTTRDYIMNNFYKGDVDKLITLDSPHEGSAIANYVQYWHDEGTLSNIFDTFEDVVPKLNTLFDISDVLELCGVYPSYFSSYLKKYDKMLAWRNSIYLKPSYLESFSKGITSSLNDYSTNQEKYGDPYTERGIKVMTLQKGKEAQGYSNALLTEFNKKENLTDSYENGYNLPYFRVVSTSGVPTPGGHGWHDLVTIPYANILAIIHGIIC